MDWFFLGRPNLELHSRDLDVGATLPAPASGPAALAGLRTAALEGGNTSDSLLEVARVASLGQMSAALYEVGGQYGRNM